jgi:hypothetical protein
LTKTRALEQLAQLVSLFKKGHAELFLLYPGLKDNPMKMAGDDMESINKKINDFFKTNSDEYLKKEFNNGLFASPVSIEQFIEKHNRIIFARSGFVSRLNSFTKKCSTERLTNDQPTIYTII